ncbi:MAG: hypothetical protein WBV94_05110 [Blastocatellia bacterium]
MGNIVEVEFTVKDNGVVRTGREISDTYGRMGSEVEQAWRAVEQAGDRAGKAAEGGLRQAKRAAKEYADAAIDATLRAEELAKAQERLQTIPKFTGKSLPAGVNVNGLDTRTGSEPLNPLAQRLLPQNQFDLSKVALEQRRLAQESERVRQITDKQFASMQKGADGTARAIGLVGQGLSSVAGVPNSQAIGQIVGAVDQFRAVNEGLETMGGRLTKIAPAAGVAAAGLFLIGNVFKSIKDDAEKVLKVVERFSALGSIGVRGGTEQTKTDLQQLQKTAADIDRLRKAGLDGDAQRLIEETLESKGAGITDFLQRLDVATGRAKQLRVDTTDPAILEQQKQQESNRQKQIHDSNELNKIRLEQSNREYEAGQRSIQLTKESQREIVNLRGQLTDNPLAKIYEAAEQRQRQFLDRFKEVPKEIKAEMQQLNTELKSLDIFKLQFDTFSKIASTQSQLEDVKKNGGSSRLTELNSIQKRRDEIEADIFKRRKEGTLDPATHRQLLNEFDQLGSKRLPLFSPNDAIQRGIDFGQKQLQLGIKEGNAAKQQIANEFILNSTNDMSKLSDVQIQARTEALERKLKQEEENLKKQQQAADTIKEAAGIYKKSSESLEEQIKKGIGINVNVTDDATKADLGTSPGADTLFGSARDFARGIGGGFTNNF